MHRFPLLMLTLLLASSAGCLSNEPLEFDVTLSSEQAAVIQTYVDGVLSETSAAEVAFNFSGAPTATTYTLAVSDGREPLTVSAEEGVLVPLTFAAHGVHNVTATAEDAKGRSASMTFSVRVNLHLVWTEEGTQDPGVLSFDPLPVHGGPFADYITIESVVSNPDLIETLGGGREVDVTWRLIDPLGFTCQQHSDVVHEGESAAWTSLYFTTYEAHDLTVDYNEGQDEIDVQHTVVVIYDPAP